MEEKSKFDSMIFSKIACEKQTIDSNFSLHKNSLFKERNTLKI